MSKSELPVFVNREGFIDGKVVKIGGDYWYDSFLPSAHSFRYHSLDLMPITVARMRGGNEKYWYAYRRINGKLRSKYIGKNRRMSYEKLQQVLKDLN